MIKKNFTAIGVIFMFSLAMPFVFGGSTGQYSSNGKVYFTVWDHDPINVTYVTDPGVYDWMNINEYSEIHFRENPSFGPIAQFAANGTTFTFQPMALQWTNAIDQIQEISQIQPVTGYPNQSRFIYENAYGPNITLMYSYIGYKLKENLIINARSDLMDPPQYILDQGNVSLTLNVNFDTAENIRINGADWDKNTDTITYGDVHITDDEGNIIYYFPRAVATDSNNNSINGFYRLKKQGGGLYLSMNLPFEWINSTSTVYPIYIDPTIITLNPQNMTIEVDPEATVCDYLECNIIVRVINNANMTATFNSSQVNFTFSIPYSESWRIETDKPVVQNITATACNVSEDKSQYNCTNITEELTRYVHVIITTQEDYICSIVDGDSRDLQVKINMSREDVYVKYNISFFMFGQTWLIDPFIQTGNTTFNNNSIYNMTYLNLQGYIELNDTYHNGTYMQTIIMNETVLWKNITLDMEGVANQSYLDTANTTDLQLLYFLDEAANPILDYSGNNNTGIYSGADFQQSGPKNYSLGFDGIDDNIIANESESLSLPVSSLTSMGGWFYFNNVTGTHVIMQKGLNANINYAVWILNGEIYFGFTAGGLKSVSTTIANLSIDQWYHIAVTYDSRPSYKDVYFYINGRFLEATALNKNLADNNDPLYIGSDSTGNYFDGYMDEIFYYNRMLTDEEIEDIFGNTVTHFHYKYRSCDDIDCIGETWSEYQHPLFTPVNVSPNRYFQYFIHFDTDIVNISSRLYSVKLGYEYMCMPTLDQDWIIDYQEICDNVSRSTGTGMIFITANGTLELRNTAKIYTASMPTIERAVTPYGWRYLIEHGSYLYVSH